MMISISKYKLPLKEALQAAGYSFRKEKNDYIREDDENGRFHILFNGTVPILHFDLYVEWRHVSFNLPHHLKREIRRIGKKIQMYKKQKHEKNISSTSKA